MNLFDDPINGVKFPEGFAPENLSEEGEFILEKLLEITCVHRIATRNSLTEFLTRIFISLDVPLDHFVASYFKTGTIFQIKTKSGMLDVDLDLLRDLIGTTISHPGKFNYIGTSNEFTQNNGLAEWPGHFYPKVKGSLKYIDLNLLKNAQTVAQFFSDKIDERFFYVNCSIQQSGQYCRKEIDSECFEIKQAVIYEPLKKLSNATIQHISNCIGETKLNPEKNFMADASRDERLEEVIKIAFGIKNGFINWNGHVGEYEKHVDPYFLISFIPIMDVYLESRTFMDLYHYWNMCEWMDALPVHD